MVAGQGFEPRPPGYEPDELPLLHPAITQTYTKVSTYLSKIPQIRIKFDPCQGNIVSHRFD